MESCVVLLCVLVPCCDVRYDFRIKQCWVRFPPSCLKECSCFMCLFAYSNVQHFVLSCVFIFWGPIRFPHKSAVRFFAFIPTCMYVGGLMSYLCYLCLFQHVLTMCVTWQVSYKRQEMLIIDVTWVYHGSFCRVRVAHLFSFCYMVFLCMFAHSDVQHFEN